MYVYVFIRRNEIISWRKWSKRQHFLVRIDRKRFHVCNYLSTVFSLLSASVTSWVCFYRLFTGLYSHTIQWSWERESGPQQLAHGDAWKRRRHFTAHRPCRSRFSLARRHQANRLWNGERDTDAENENRQVEVGRCVFFCRCGRLEGGGFDWEPIVNFLS